MPPQDLERVMVRGLHDPLQGVAETAGCGGTGGHSVRSVGHIAAYRGMLVYAKKMHFAEVVLHPEERG